MWRASPIGWSGRGGIVLDDQRLAIVREGFWNIPRGARSDKCFSCGSPCLSADAQHIAFKVLGEDGKMAVAYGGREGRELSWRELALK